jgi:hypothetical protein
MNQELQRMANQLAQASRPEEVFGDIHVSEEEKFSILQKNYRAMARIAHPDMYRTTQEQILAQRTFYLLTEWLEKAKEKMRWGEYGSQTSSSGSILRTRKRDYRIFGTYVDSRIFRLYPCSFREDRQTHRCILKLVRDPRDNHRIETEGRALRTLARGQDVETFSAYVPNLIDAFVYESSRVERQALVLEQYDGWYSLEDVHHAYPDGIDPKDMAWMWRRLLVALGFSHANHIVHGAVLPRNIWILPEEHGLMLVNWSCAVFDPLTAGVGLRAHDSEDAGWYPQEIWKGEIPSSGTDICMSAKCMVWLLGGDPQTKVFPGSVPIPLKAFLKGCMLPVKRAPHNAWSLKEEFDELLERLWGKRTFHPFSMK